MSRNYTILFAAVVIFFYCEANLLAQPKTNGKLLRHFVIITFKNNAPENVISSVDNSFANLAKLPMVKGFEWGVVTEEGKSQVKHIYITTFSNKQGEDQYGKSREHQAHIKLGAEYVESVKAIDYYVAD